MASATGEHISDYARSTMEGGVYVEWSGDQRMFRVVSEESMEKQFSALGLRPDMQQERNETNQADQELEELTRRFKYCLGDYDLSSAILEMQALRTRILTKILESRTPLRWFPGFLVAWQNLLSFIGECGDIQFPSIDFVEYCRELTALANGWKLIGDVAQARSTLGKCFEVTRRNLKVPLAETAPFEDDDSQALRCAARSAKKLLLDCVAFQSSLDRTKELFGRHEAPAHVLSSLSKDFWTLIREAPFSVELAISLAQCLMKQRQFALVTRFLEYSPFSGEDGELTLIHAQALTYVGFYRQAIWIAEVFTTQHNEITSAKPLQSYCDQLVTLLAYREKADEWLRLDQYEKAMTAYDECLALVDPADHKQIAALLFGYANALLGLEKVSAAIKDFEKSLQLDPSNKVASIRLQTACLQLQTARIKKEISGNRLNNKPRRMSKWYK
ncbi:hypothetical protein PPTG_16572 [Phytophthora nicotianae INRA-310]|uniref:Uncharacterized protein n=1 Tax=Phytophthora nicotianae (strain INRA-310) TaxID=761204 RepID=W2PQT6_PHYN3|nr:hypothetical protein PPTG_16572 [Phytophthora nicotianae INRA-310]ETN02350.1 hypothetical protein PPTG_16572 [Phytophthora nicotianae INRA-310]